MKVKLVEAGAVTDGDIENLIFCFFVNRGGEQVGLHSVANVTKISAYRAISRQQFGLEVRKF